MTLAIKKLNTADLTAADSFFRSKAAKLVTQDYFSYVYTSMLQYVQTGDVAVLNSVLAASRLVSRIRITAQLVRIVTAHSLDGNGKYNGTANKVKLKRLRITSDTEIKNKVLDIINAEATKREAKATTFNVDMTTTRAVNALAALLAHDVDVDLTALLKLAQERKDKIAKNVPVEAPVAAKEDI